MLDHICEIFDSACACISCRPIGFCIDNPCQDCEGPTLTRCEPPEEHTNATD